jgi:hypothetical protein
MAAIQQAEQLVQEALADRAVVVVVVLLVALAAQLAQAAMVVFCCFTN